jgi:hypothetical protein
MNKQDTVFDQLMADPSSVSQLGAAIGVALGHAQESYRGKNLPGMPDIRMKETSLTTSQINIYGRYSIFDPCTAGDIFGLQVATHGLMNWLGFRSNKFYRRRVDFITWWGPEGTYAETSNTGAVAPCDDPDGWEYGTCGYELLHTSWYARAGEALDPHTIVQDRCETTPRYRLNGKQITDDVEWQANGIMNVLQQGIRRDLIHGNHANANEMNGLEQLIVTGYTDANSELCPMVDSILVDWASDDLDGDVNGLGNFFDYLDEVITEIEWRASAMGTIGEQDMAIVTSRFMATCLLDAFACYTTCGVTSTGDITDQALRANQRAARRELNGGPLYDGRNAVGYIHLKRSGDNYCTDVYILSRKVGSIDVLYGEYLDLRVWESRVRKHDKDFRGRSDQGGRFAMKGKEDNFCTQLIIGTSPEIYLAAPWAQVRFSDVCCARERQPLTGDPFQKDYMPGGSNLYPAGSYE